MDAPKKLLFFLLLLPAALCVMAAGTGKVEGVLNGYVKDAVTKKPLSGVVVCAMIPGTNLQKEVTTDADGYFRFVELPASQVTVEFNKRGYQSFKRGNITIKEKTSVKLNIEFNPDNDDMDSATEYPVLCLLQAY